MQIRCGPATVIGEAPPCRPIPLPSLMMNDGGMPGIATAPLPGAGRRRDAVSSHQPGGLPTGYVSGCTARTSERMTNAAPPDPAPTRASANGTSANQTPANRTSVSGHGPASGRKTGYPALRPPPSSSARLQRLTRTQPGLLLARSAALLRWNRRYSSSFAGSIGAAPALSYHTLPYPTRQRVN